MTRFKGAMVSPGAPYSDLADLTGLGAGIFRYQVHYGQYGSIEYFQNEVVPLFSQQIILDLHRPVEDKEWITEFWFQQAKLIYPPNIIFGLINEPGFKDSYTFQKDLIKMIRAIDPDRRISITPRHSSPQSFKSILPSPKTGIFYEAHMYHPMSFTHQGVYNYPPGKLYPTPRNNKDKLVAHLKPLRDFQKKYRKRIVIGEFGCSVYADSESRYNWFKDCIDIFNDYRWSFCLHAWREALVWNIEDDPKILGLFEKEWEKNQ